MWRQRQGHERCLPSERGRDLDTILTDPLPGHCTIPPALSCSGNMSVAVLLIWWEFSHMAVYTIQDGTACRHRDSNLRARSDVFHNALTGSVIDVTHTLSCIGLLLARYAVSALNGPVA